MNIDEAASWLPKMHDVSHDVPGSRHSSSRLFGLLALTVILQRATNHSNKQCGTVACEEGIEVRTLAFVLLCSQNSGTFSPEMSGAKGSSVKLHFVCSALASRT